MDDDYLYKQLIEKKCIKTGLFTLKSGEISSFYVDIKSVISYPHLVRYIGDKIFHLLDEFDIICGIPHGGLPIASYISTTYNKPLIYVREKTKEYGIKRLIEGEYKESDRCVIIDDVLTSGGSLERVQSILSKEVNIVDRAVVVSRSKDYQIKSLLKL